MDNWGKYEALVLDKLERLEESSKEVKDTMTAIQLEVQTLKVKAALWGSLAGAGVAGVFSLIVGLILRAVKL